MHEAEVQEEWSFAIIIPLYTGKGSREICRINRGIRFLSIPIKVYGRVMIEMVKEIPVI